MTIDYFFDPLFDLLVTRHGVTNLKNALDELAVEPGAGDALSPTATDVRRYLIDEGIIMPHDPDAPANNDRSPGAAMMLIKGGFIDNGHRTLGWYRKLLRRELE